MQKLKQTNKQKIPWKPRKAIELYDKEYKVELQYRLIEQKQNNFVWHWISCLSYYDLNGLLSYSHLSLA